MCIIKTPFSYLQGNGKKKSLTYKVRECFLTGAKV